MPAQQGSAPITMIFVMPHQIARGPIRCPRRVQRPILTARDMHAGIDLEAPGHAARASGSKQSTRFFTGRREIGAATQIERIGMQTAFIQRDGSQQPFRYAMRDFGLARGNKAG